MLRSEGLRRPGGVAETVPTRLATVPLTRALADGATPLVELLCHLNTGIKTADAQLVTLATANPVVARLMTAPAQPRLHLDNARINHTRRPESQ